MFNESGLSQHSRRNNNTKNSIVKGYIKEDIPNSFKNPKINYRNTEELTADIFGKHKKPYYNSPHNDSNSINSKLLEFKSYEDEIYKKSGRNRNTSKYEDEIYKYSRKSRNPSGFEDKQYKTSIIDIPKKPSFANVFGYQIYFFVDVII